MKRSDSKNALVAFGVVAASLGASISLGQALYTEGPGVNLPFAQIRDDIQASTSGYSGTDIDVNNALVEGGLYGEFGVQSPLRLHTLSTSSTAANDNWSRWYQTDGATQVFRLFPGEENVRNDRALAARIEAFDANTGWNIDDGEWHDWVGRYTIVNPINAAILQVKDNDNDDWSMQLSMTAAGGVHVTHRRPLPGQPKTETLIENAIGQPFDIRVRDNGLDYEVFFGDQSTPFTSGRYIRNDEPGDTSDTFFRWGIYVGAQEVRSEALIFVSHASVDPVLPTIDPPPVVLGSLLVGWDTWSSGSETASLTDFGATGLATESSGDWRENGEAASDDGSFGGLLGASTSDGDASAGTYIGQTTGDGSYDFSITAGADGLVLSSFNFDARRKRNGSPDNWSVTTLSGAITTGVTVGSGTLGNILGSVGPSDHDDFELSLAGLADNVLAPGESATFRLSFSGGTVSNTDQKTYLDNVAILGALATPAGVPGDFNGDGVVDAADYTVWRDNLGATGLEPYAVADGTGDGNITAEDYTVWREQYGMTLADPSSSPANSLAVPEPASLLLVLACLYPWARRI